MKPLCLSFREICETQRGQTVFSANYVPFNLFGPPEGTTLPEWGCNLECNLLTLIVFQVRTWLSLYQRALRIVIISAGFRLKKKKGAVRSRAGFIWDWAREHANKRHATVNTENWTNKKKKRENGWTDGLMAGQTICAEGGWLKRCSGKDQHLRWRHFHTHNKWKRQVASTIAGVKKPTGQSDVLSGSRTFQSCRKPESLTWRNQTLATDGQRIVYT